jgi:hypothetical protein
MGPPSRDCAPLSHVSQAFPPEALQHFVDHGVSRPHKLDPNDQGIKLLGNFGNGRLTTYTTHSRWFGGIDYHSNLGLGFADGRPSDRHATLYDVQASGATTPDR